MKRNNMAAKSGQAIYLNKKEPSGVSYRFANWLIPLIVVCGVFIWAGDQLSNPQTLPVNKIRVHGAFVNVDEAMLHHAIDGMVSGGYFNVDVDKVRDVVEQLPWVSKASVRRVWPDTLSVSVTEQQPVAFSKRFGLINADGEIFKPATDHFSKTLPELDGPENLNKLMLQKYREINKLLSAIDEKVSYLKIDARHALELRLDNGLKIVLGHDETKRRLERLISIYKKTLASRSGNIETIDLRYTNGMAIRWKKITENKKGA